MPGNCDRDHPIIDDDGAVDCPEVMLVRHVLSAHESIDGQRTPDVGTDRTSKNLAPLFQDLPCPLSDYESWEPRDGHREIYEVERQLHRRLFGGRMFLNQYLRRSRHFDAIAEPLVPVLLPNKLGGIEFEHLRLAHNRSGREDADDGHCEQCEEG